MYKNRLVKFTSFILSLILIFSLVGCRIKIDDMTKSYEIIEEHNKTAKNANKKDNNSAINMMRDARGENGVVASAKPEASQVGIEIMKKGGNAIDAAVATAFALSVTEPNASGIGGGGFMLIRFAETGEEIFLDFREMAPASATADMYELDEDGEAVNDEQTLGGKAAAIPGEVAGLLMALEKYGSMTRKEVMQPAIDLAENGFIVTDNFSEIITENFEKISKFDGTKKIYLKDGLPFKAGDIIKSPDLADTLRIIAEEGKDAFYKGVIARDIVKASRETGGIFTLEDLANYEVKLRKPIRGTYRGYEIISAPPSSSGGIHIIQLLNILENYGLKELGHNSTQSLHLWSEASKLMFADKEKYMADTDFVEAPLVGLASKEYARELTNKINLNKSAKNVEFGNPYKYETGSTTHLSVMDKQGNMVAMTKTINYFFGSGVTVAGRGFLLNNEMDDFNAKPGTSNSIEPKKRPLSNMTPTLVLKNGKPFLTLGSPGATRIIPTVAQIISNIIDHDMNVQEAINAVRMFDMTGTLALEGRIDSNIIKELQEMGHEVDVKADLDPYFGGVQCIMMEESGKLHGGGDPRRDGQAIGY